MAAVSFLLLALVILLFPLVLAVAVAYFEWRRSSRPWWFLLSATIILFSIYFVIADYWRVPLVVTLPTGAGSRVDSSDWGNVLALVALLKPLSLLVVVSVPVLGGLLRFFRQPVRTSD